MKYNVASFQVVATSVLLSLLALGVHADETQFVVPTPETVVVPAPKTATVSIDLRDIIEPVNRKVMGVCLMYPPFDPACAALFKGVLDGTSGRAWAHLTTDEQWAGFMPFVNAVGIKELFAYDPKFMGGPGGFKQPAKYLSEKENNLFATQQPKVYAEVIKTLNKTPHPGFPDGYGVTGWEVWNEPGFAAAGNWPTEDFARYAVDCSREIRRVEPTMDIGVPLYDGADDWRTRNPRLLRQIAAKDLNAINFVVTHPYSCNWFNSREQFGTYYARVSSAEEVRPFLRDVVKTVFDIGHGRWRVACTEWNTHPPAHEVQYWHISTDMAAAIHIAAMFGVFWDEHVDSAQVFEFFGPPEGAPQLNHFHLVSKTPTGLKVNPTGEVFRLYGRYFRGDRLTTKLDASTYTYYAQGENAQNLPKEEKPQKVKYEIPLVFAHAAHDAANGRLVVMLTNRHLDKAAPVKIRLSNFRAAQTGKCLTLTTKDAESTESIIQEAVATNAGGNSEDASAQFKVVLPPHSVTAVLIEGEVPLTAAEMFSKNIKWVNDWRVGTIMDPVEGSSNHGLEVSLPPSVTQPKRAIKAKADWGFIDLGAVLAEAGKFDKLSEGYQAVATSWVFSPCAREVNFSLGLDYWGTFSVNGKAVLSVQNRSNPVGPDTHRVKTGLRCGWNRLDVRLASGSKGMGFWLGIENLKDLKFSAAPEPPAWPKQWELMAKDGAYVIDHPDGRDANYSNKEVLEISPGPFRRAFIRWPIDKSSHGIAPADLSFRMILNRAYSNGANSGEGKVYIRPVVEKWNALETTYNKQPKLGPPLPMTAELKSGQWVFSGKELDALIKKWFLKPGENYGIAVEGDGPSGTFGAFFNVNSPDKGPQLEIIRHGE